MPFRPDLDLSDFIEDYEPWFDGTKQIEQVPSTAPSIPQTPISKTTRVVHNGALLASSCTALDIPNRIVWDVNGWYAMLGADTHADRKALREAYIANQCWRSDYATYVFQQLLDPEVRAAYDAMPLGRQFMADKFVQAAIHQAAHTEAAKRARATGVGVTRDAYAQVLDEMGYLMPDEDEPDPDAPELVRHTSTHVFDDEDWRWSYYLNEVDCHDVVRLRDWQSMLITALSEVGETVHFAVGFTAQKNSESKGFTKIEGTATMVAYLGALTQPSPALAEKVAKNLLITNTP